MEANQSQPGASGHTVLVDVALLPAAAAVAAGRVLVLVDQIRASTTITAALDLGCAHLVLAGDVATARNLAGTRGWLLAGEQQAQKPPDFDLDNSPSDLSRSEIRGCGLVLCTTNGTAVASRLRTADHLLFGCLRNARAVATAALDRARVAQGGGEITIVCAGREGRFVLDDAVAAGVIAARIAEHARDGGVPLALTDGARAAIRLRSTFPDLLTAMTDCDGGRTLRSLGREDDITFCAEEDASETVPMLAAGPELEIVAASRAPAG